MGEPCSYDDALGVMVHRYDMGHRRCRCGRVDNPAPVAGDYKWGHHPAKLRERKVRVRSPVMKREEI